MHPNAHLIDGFYRAFAVNDHVAMARSYSDAATFSDPVFPALDAAQLRAMWRMFCESDNEIAVAHYDVDADDRRGTARWEAIYEFPPTGRRVHNKIDASFEFSDGLITRHRDAFDLYRWTRMALGPLGTVVGWSPIVQNRVRGQAAARLKRFQGERPPGPEPVPH